MNKPAKSLPKLVEALSRTGTALIWRNGFWQLLRRDGRIQKLRPAVSAVVADMVNRGTLVVGDDGLARVSSARAAPARNANESPLSRLAMAKNANGSPCFDAEQLRAGERLRQDHERAHLAPRVTANYAPAEARGDRHFQMSDNAIENLTEGTLAARERLHHALSAVGPELSGILMQVCCMISGLEEAERQLQLPRRSGKAVLNLALTRLARHYGMKPRLSHAGTQRIGHWAVDDFRPEIPARSE